MGLLDEMVRRVEELDTTAVRQVLSLPDGRYRWPRFRVNEVELEWRRWRIRRLLGHDEQAPAAVLQYERLSTTLGLPESTLAPAPDGPLVRLSYDEMFPQGALITKAAPHRVARASSDVDTHDPDLLDRSIRRHAEYLAKLDGAPRWWTVPDLASRATRRACARDVAALKPPPGSSFAGGPCPGWDARYDALTSRSKTVYLGAGPTLTAIHEDPVLVNLISERMGRRMYPTRCTYLPYRKGDFLGVHTDQPTCEVSLLFTIDGEPGPLRSYFAETTNDPMWLDRWVQENGNFPDGGEDYVYGEAEGYALTGRVVPHARLPQNEYALIGALFYSGLV